MIYSDLDFSLSKSITGDFNVLSDEESVKQSIDNIIQTLIGFNVRFEQPAFGSQLYFLLSEKPNRFTGRRIRNEIRNALENYEPRITLDDITVNFQPENYFFIINIFYTIVTLGVSEKFEIKLGVNK